MSTLLNIRNAKQKPQQVITSHQSEWPFSETLQTITAGEDSGEKGISSLMLNTTATDTVKDGVMVIEAKKTRLKYSLTPYTQNKLKYYKDLNVRMDTRKV